MRQTFDEHADRSFGPRHVPLIRAEMARRGLDGFLIPTAMPVAPFGAAIAAAYERGALNYDYYCGAVALPTSVDIATLVDRLTALVTDPDLRRRLRPR